MTDKNFYKNKSILVTGGDGFIGSHLVRRLIQEGGKVYITSYFKELFNLNGIKDSLEGIFFCDITKKEEVEKIKCNFDMIFHLAANISVDDSGKNPEKIRIINVIGTKHILDLAVKQKVNKFIYASTSTVYNWSDNFISEENEIKPLTPYGETKLEGENLCFEYKDKFLLNVAIPRFFNVYGIKQNSDVVASFIKNALNNKDIIIEGDGKQKRDFINITDVVNAFLLMGSEESAKNQIINFGTGKGITIVELAEKIIKISNSSSKVVHTKSRDGDGHYVCDYKKAKMILGWEPEMGINEGLKEMIEWAKSGGYYDE